MPVGSGLPGSCPTMVTSLRSVTSTYVLACAPVARGKVLGAPPAAGCPAAAAPEAPAAAAAPPAPEAAPAPDPAPAPASEAELEQPQSRPAETKNETVASREPRIPYLPSRRLD